MLELCVLAVLRKEDSYGYQIIKDVSDLIEISESTLYPILRRLEMGGKVKSYTTQYNNRLRKYFHLTEEGRQYLKNFDKDRAQLLKILDYIAEEDEKISMCELFDQYTRRGISEKEAEEQMKLYW